MTESEKNQMCWDIKEELDVIENQLVELDMPKEKKNPLYDQVSKARCMIKYLYIQLGGVDGMVSMCK